MSWTTRPDDNDPATPAAAIRGLNEEIQRQRTRAERAEQLLGDERARAWRAMERAERAEAAFREIADDGNGWYWRAVKAEATLARVRDLRDMYDRDSSNHGSRPVVDVEAETTRCVVVDLTEALEGEEQ